MLIWHNTSIQVSVYSHFSIIHSGTWLTLVLQSNGHSGLIILCKCHFIKRQGALSFSNGTSNVFKEEYARITFWSQQCREPAKTLNEFRVLFSYSVNFKQPKSWLRSHSVQGSWVEVVEGSELFLYISAASALRGLAKEHAGSSYWRRAICMLFVSTIPTGKPVVQSGDLQRVDPASFTSRLLPLVPQAVSS